MIELIKLHFKNKQHSLIQITLILLSIMLLGVAIQLISWKMGHLDTNTIKIPMFLMGPWIGTLGGLFVLARGRNGEGKFLSRLPMTKYEVFLGKVIFLAILYAVLAATLFSAAWLIAGIVKLLYPSLHFSGIPTFQGLGQDSLSFLKLTAPFLFLAALGFWLQKWFSSDTARNLLVLGILAITIAIPILTMLLSPNHFLILTNNSIARFFERFHGPLLAGLDLALFFGAMGLYRLRHFRNF